MGKQHSPGERWPEDHGSGFTTDVAPALHPARKRVSVVPTALWAGARRQAAIPLLPVSTAGRYLDFMHFPLNEFFSTRKEEASVSSPFYG